MLKFNYTLLGLFSLVFSVKSQEKSMPLISEILSVYESQSLSNARRYFKENGWHFSDTLTRFNGKLIFTNPESDIKEFEYTKDKGKVWLAIVDKEIERIVLHPILKSEVLLLNQQLISLKFDLFRKSSESIMNLVISKETYRKDNLEVKILSIIDKNAKPTKYTVFIANKNNFSTGEP